MKRLLFVSLVAALCVGIIPHVKASGTNVPVDSSLFGASGDYYKFTATRVVDGHTNNLVTFPMKSWSEVSSYYNSGCNCYLVPLSYLGWSGFTLLNDEVHVWHYVPGSGPGCSGGLCLQEDLVLILA